MPLFWFVEFACAKELNEHKVPCCAIRQKVGQAISNNIRNNDISEDRTKQELVDYLRTQGVECDQILQFGTC